MRFLDAGLPGAYLIVPERRSDDRGFFARTGCEREFAAQGLNTRWAQCSISYNRKKGTLRGMHYQAPPHGEVKLIRCTRGAVYDVLLDLRTDSPGYRQWRHFRLTARNCCMLYVPEGIAHGFQTLEDDTEVFYQISRCYAPEAARGVRWNDAAFAIRWPPCAGRILSARDRDYPDYRA